LANPSIPFLETLTFPDHWNAGVAPRSRAPEPPIQVHWLGANTIMLRQSKTLSYEAPFLYLLFGRERAVLWDTGATADPNAFPLRITVDALIREWLADHPCAAYELVVAHTHAHGDHIAADGQFTDRPRTAIVGHGVDAVQQFFHITDWPLGTGVLDLGDRVLEIIPIPGHQAASVAVYDPWTGMLLTGDTVYPGRLYVADYPAFVTSLTRLRDFAHQHPISAVLGCHVEMTNRPGREYPLGATYQPQEASLVWTPAHIDRVWQASKTASTPGIHRHPEFAIVHGQSARVILPLMVRGILWKIGYRLRR
jgi:hydroxyacylglutathione hydrolase